MTQEKQFSDEELVAYLDGESDFAPIAEIEVALNADASLSARIEALRIDKDAIAASFAGLAITDRQKPTLPETSSIPKRFGYGSIAAAALIALLVGYGTGIITPRMGTPGWKGYVAAYQALYANSTLAHLKQSDEAKSRELTRVAAAIGKSIVPGALQISPAIDYKRAQILSFKGRPLIQLAFLSSTGDPMALCIIKSGSGATSELKSAAFEGMSAAYWSRDGYDYLLIGGNDHNLIDELAARYAKTI